MGHFFAIFLAAFAIFQLTEAQADGPRSLTGFLAHMEPANAHYRTAASYLRTGNLDAAAIETEGFIAAWRQLMDRYEGTPPWDFADGAAFMQILGNILSRAEDTLRLIDEEKTEEAYAAILPVREDLSALRRSRNIYTLNDCILDLNKVMDRFFRFYKQPPDWSRNEDVYTLVGDAEIYRHILERCDKLTTPEIRNDSNYRRLVDGLRHEFSFMPRVVAEKNKGLLFRILGAVRSYDRLLFFRFG